MDTWAPKLTLIVVTKRHHARFYPKETCPLPGDKKVDKNLDSGTMVDRTVVYPHLFDFYLQSHHSALGTARVAHYVVISNDAKYTANDIQQIVNDSCS